jgi:tRNA A-37 threonylcarbamoyl transferase component Bud32
MVPQGMTPSNAPLPLFVHLVRGRARADVAPVLADPLGSLLDRDVADWPAAGLQPRKERTVRTVLQGELGGIDVHVKVFRADTLTDRARDVLRGPRGARELHNLLAARGLGLPVVEPLASGLATDGATLRSFVVTRTVAGAQPFHFGLDAALLQRVGALLRNMHDLGMLPGDLHPGNLVVDADGDPVLLDLTSVRHAGAPGLAARAAALAFFCHELDGGALDPAAAPLLAAYQSATEPLAPGFRRELVFATRRWRAQALPAFGRRCTRPCRHTEVPARRRGQPRWYWRAQVPAALRSRCEELAMSPPPPTRLGRRGGVWLDEALAMKQRDAGAAKKLWRASYWLLFARVTAPAPIALRTLAGVGHVFVERLGNVSIAAELAAGALDTETVQRAAASLGSSVGRLHAPGLRNRDLKFDNLVRDPATDTVAMVDLDGVARKSATDTRATGADLGRLLAAFRAAGSPGGTVTLRAFLRSWLRSHRQLLQRPPLRQLLRVAEQRASAWASAHRAPPPRTH